MNTRLWAVLTVENKTEYSILVYRLHSTFHYMPRKLWADRFAAIAMREQKSHLVQMYGEEISTLYNFFYNE